MAMPRGQDVVVKRSLGQNNVNILYVESTVMSQPALEACPNVMDYYALTTADDDSEGYLVMPYGGQDLAQMLDDHRQAHMAQMGDMADYTGLPVGQVKSITRQLLTVHQAFKAAGVMYRDMKLDNVVMDGNERVRVIDMGWAKAVQAHGLAACGRPRCCCRQYNTQADIHALGQTLFEMRFGYTVFTERIVHGQLIDLRNNPMAALTDMIAMYGGAAWSADQKTQIHNFLGAYALGPARTEAQVKASLLHRMTALRPQLHVTPEGGINHETQVNRINAYRCAL
ncbi:unnamed protein product [Vitrella brassicaformis CCMP3155]|uniref:Protein kinase domain-containing protein n=1 Tax=Vitrella brassicaformis (strain CCMP3155) TaxID=1169540 RepID=A0A0G4EX53_VITBC|nr:unnamed protein product [Vitrella brassicaformis CCMP3155]|eukprot:CEM03373.1 unnamed protein product [Vitrella brassicaformis CCMP3155]